MKSLSMILLFSVLFLSGCTNSKVYTGVELDVKGGSLSVTIGVDDEGRVLVSGDAVLKKQMGLGPISLIFGIEKTFELSKKKTNTLFVIWEDDGGEIRVEEYEIGMAFHVNFTQNELIQEIQGDNNNVIVVIRKPKAETPVSEPPIPQSSPEQFIRDYYQAINNREYEYTWSLLSDNFHNNINKRGGFQEAYVDWWNTVDSVEILEATVSSQSESQAEVFVIARYHYKNRTTTTSEGVTNRLIKNISSDTWLIEPINIQ